MADEDFPTEPCRSCQQPVIWTVTTKGKSMPVNPDVTPDGNVALQWMAGRVLADVLNVQRQAARTPGTLRKSHFATCRDAGSWRRSRER